MPPYTTANSNPLFVYPQWWCAQGARNQMITQYGNDRIDKVILVSRDKEIKIKVGSDKEIETKAVKSFNLCTIANKKRLANFLEEYNHSMYEILPTNEPRKLYFDLEMENQEGKEDTFQNKYANFLHWVLRQIKEILFISIRDETVLVLDSCREGKLSYHVVFTEGIYFENNTDLKSFIKFLWRRLESSEDYYLQPITDPATNTPIKLNDALTWYKGEEKRFIFDDVPYGSFQNIRMCNQSKLGKRHKLKIERPEIFTFEDTFIRIYNQEEVEGKVKADPSKWEPLVNEEPSQQKKSSSPKQPKEKTEAQKGGANWSHFNFKGNTLRELKDMNFEDMEKLPLWKQYLYLIPNPDGGQGYEDWRNIGFAIKNCGGAELDWREWSKLAKNRYTDGETNEFNKFREDTNSQGFGELKNHNFNIYSLLKLAKKACPEYFKNKIPSFQTYFDWNLEDIKVLEEDTPYVSQGNGNILDPAKFILMSAYMGKGKTTACKRLLEHHKFEKYLILSSRQSFANFMASEFDIPCYLDFQGDALKMNGRKNLVISVESLYKLHDSNDYDAIFIDEVESILA
jgi:hypothetical protein